jgi:hypothetical protein
MANATQCHPTAAVEDFGTTGTSASHSSRETLKKSGLKNVYNKFIIIYCIFAFQVNLLNTNYQGRNNGLESGNTKTRQFLFWSPQSEELNT